LKRATIVEKWWHDKIKKEARQSETLRKEVKSGEVEERHMEYLQRMRRQEILASQRLNEREVWRERIPQEVGKEGKGADIREEEVDMNLEEEREDSASTTGEIGNPVKEIPPVEESETPPDQIKSPRS
jgi:hypothetical protein